MAVQNIYSVPPPPLEKHHEEIHQNNSASNADSDLRDGGQAQANEVLTSSNTAVMEQLAQMNVTMNAIQAQLKILESTPTDQTRLKRENYCWDCRRNYTHRSKT